VESGGKVADIFRDIIDKEVANANFKTKKALDPFDVLAFARKFANLDHIVIFVQLEKEDKETKEAFLAGLATLEADTGKNIFKCIYYDDEDGEAAAKDTADEFLEYAYGKAPPKEEEESD